MKEIKAPFSREDFIRASFKLELPENAPQTRAKPRVSGVLDCSRQQMYSMQNVPRSNPEEEDFGRNHQNITNEIHREAEAVTASIIAQLGFTVVDRQVSLPVDYPMTGHPDGRLVPSELGRYWAKGEASLIDGLVWGFEHKVIGYLQYIKVFDKGLFAAKPEYITQALLYGDALGWDCVLFVILADDAAATKGKRTQSPNQGWAKRDDWNPKVQLVPIDLRPLKPLVGSFHARAEALTEAASTVEAAEVKREFSGTSVFPCGYCDWHDRCNIDGEGSLVIPKGALDVS